VQQVICNAVIPALRNFAPTRRFALESNSFVQDGVFYTPRLQPRRHPVFSGAPAMAESTNYQSVIAQRTPKRQRLFAAATALVAGVVARISERLVKTGIDCDVVLGEGNTTGTTTSILKTWANGTALDLFSPEGSTGAGLLAEGSSHGAIGALPSTSSSFGAGVFGETLNSAPYGAFGYDSSQSGANVSVAGLITNGWGVGGFNDSGYGISGAGGGGVVSGTNGACAKSATVPHPDGTQYRLYCMESPERWLEDFGKGKLECGQSDVRIDPDFAAVVDLNDYHVFLTPYDDFELRVSGQTAEKFTVQAKDATANGRFSWRMVAKRKDTAAPRFETVVVRPTVSRSDMFATH
jgi:hypothetical protein